MIPGIRLSHLVLIAALTSRAALGAPCCGAGSAAPTIITGDDQAQFSVALSRTQVIGDAPVSGAPVFRDGTDRESSETIRLDGAILLSDRWQAGASLPITHRSRTVPDASDSATGLGDFSLNAAYELLPEWGYSDWRPRGFVYLQAVIPTGKSVYDGSSAEDESLHLLSMDQNGKGFFTPAAGALFVKSWSLWDALLTAEIHHGLARDTATGSSGGQPIRVSPGWGGSIGIGAGASPSFAPIRLGALISPAYEGALQVEGGAVSRSEPQLVWNASLQLAWMPTRLSSLTATYSDQTFFGPATNVTLNRGISLAYQLRWER